MANFVEILSDGRYREDGVNQASAARVFEYDGLVDQWRGEIEAAVPKGSAHPVYSDLRAEDYTIDPLIGNARARVTVLYSNYGKYSRFVYIPPKVGDRVKWTQGTVYVEDRFFVNEKIRALEVDNPTPVDRWQPLEIKIAKQPRELRKAVVTLPRLTEPVLAYITSQSGKLHYNPGGDGSPEVGPAYASGKWFMFEAPDGIETSKEEVQLTYTWRHDPGIKVLPIQLPPGDVIALPNTLYGYFRLPFHTLVPYYLGGDRTVQPSYLQTITTDVGGTQGRGWLSLPGMVL